MSTIALLVPTERGCICAVNSGMNDHNKKEQVMLWRAAVMALGRALRHEYENKQEEMPDSLCCRVKTRWGHKDLAHRPVRYEVYLSRHVKLRFWQSLWT